MRRRWPAAVFALLAAAAPAAGELRQVSMRDFVQDVWDGADSGLPHPGVQALRQTRDGYLWIATFRGLVRFDGATFKAPEVSDPRARAALSDHIRCFLETRDGSMWIGTRREGLLRLRGGQAEVLTEADGVPNDVTAMAEAPDGTLWLAAARGLVARDPGGRLRVFGREHGVDERVTALFVDGDGAVWAGTGRYRVGPFDGTRFQLRPLAIPAPVLASPDSVPGMPGRSVLGLTRDASGVLWAATSVGLARVPETPSARADFLPTGSISALWAGGDSLWLATAERGLARLTANGLQWYTSGDGLLTDDLVSIYEDPEGSLWVGTRNGLARLRPRVIRTYTQRDGVGHDTITCVLEDRRGVVWAGHRNGLSRFEHGAWTTLGVADGLPHPSVRALAEGPDGALWIGTLDGLVRLKDGRFATVRGQDQPYSVRALAFDDKDRLWIAALGLDRLEGSAVRRIVPVQQLCGAGVPNMLHLDGRGGMWLGKNSVVVRVRDGAVECVDDPEVPARNDVRAIHEEADGTLWVGSIGGLFRIRGDHRDVFAGLSGPFAATVYGVVPDATGALWCSTGTGLYRIDRRQLDAGATSASLSVYRSYGTADGMDTPVGVGGGQPSAWRGRDGRLWFTTATGVAVVDPRRISMDTFVPPVQVTEIRADRRPVPLAGEPRLAPGTRDLELDFALLSFVAPERIRYKYKLEGYDPDWVDSGNRATAYYSKLPPGRYRFRVLAANHNGIWTAEGARLSLTQLPSLHQTLWFRALGLFALGLSVASVHRLRVRRLHRQEAELAREVDEAVAGLQALQDVGRAVGSTLELETVLSTIVARAVQLSGAEGGAIYEYADERGGLDLKVTHLLERSIVEELVAGLERPLGEQGAIGGAAGRRATVQVSDLEAVADGAVLHRGLLAHGYRALLAVPLLFEGELMGCLVLLRRTPGEFSRDVRQRLDALASQSVLAIRNARLFREIAEKGRELEVASRHKSEFLARMSHELRTPLNAVIGYSELILDDIYGAVPDRVRDVLGRVEKNGRHLLGLIDDVLDLSKIETGRLELEMGDYSMAEVVHAVVSATEGLAREKGLLVTAHVAEAMPRGRGDARRIAQILVNLVGNAIKFTEAGEVRIEVSLVDEGYRVAVIDTGPGIDPEDHERIFAEFEQAEDRAPRKAGGTGLGLSIAKRIVELHDGRIGVDSSVGCGATFWFTLPVRAGAMERPT